MFRCSYIKVVVVGKQSLCYDSIHKKKNIEEQEEAQYV